MYPINASYYHPFLTWNRNFKNAMSQNGVTEIGTWLCELQNTVQMLLLVSNDKSGGLRQSLDFWAPQDYTLSPKSYHRSRR